MLHLLQLLIHYYNYVLFRLSYLNKVMLDMQKRNLIKQDFLKF
jgi:hypothetical protein